MKLLFHEKILGIASLIFIAVTLTYAVNYCPKVNLVTTESGVAAPYLININTADANELISLDGIGDKTASAIISYRTKHGNFKSITELRKVSGIGNSTLNKVKDYIKV